MIAPTTELLPPTIWAAVDLVLAQWAALTAADKAWIQASTDYQERTRNRREIYRDRLGDADISALRAMGLRMVIRHTLFGELWRSRDTEEHALDRRLLVWGDAELEVRDAITGALVSDRAPGDATALMVPWRDGLALVAWARAATEMERALARDLLLTAGENYDLYLDDDDADDADDDCSSMRDILAARGRLRGVTDARGTRRSFVRGEIHRGP